jgi:hypothetical protein
VFSVGFTPRLYNEDPRPAEAVQLSEVKLSVVYCLVEDWQLSRTLQGRLRRDGAIIELTVDNSSVLAAVTEGPERGKLKNLHC